MIDVNGVGYLIFCSNRTLGALAGARALGIACMDMPDALFAADAVLDFTTPAATLAHARLAAAQGRVLVIGTTGIDAPQADELEAEGRVHPVLRVVAQLESGQTDGAPLVVEREAMAGRFLQGGAHQVVDVDRDVRIYRSHEGLGDLAALGAQ